MCVEDLFAVFPPASGDVDEVCVVGEKVCDGAGVVAIPCIAKALGDLFGGGGVRGGHGTQPRHRKNPSAGGWV